MCDNKNKELSKIPTDILEVLDYYSLKYSSVGKRPMMCCIFHNDDTPSMAIYPETNSFYCFGCGKSGTPENIVMKMEGCSYQDALKMLYGKGYEWAKLNKKKNTDDKLNISYLYKILGRNIKEKIKDCLANEDKLKSIKRLILSYSKKEVDPIRLIDCLREIKNI